MKTVVVFWSEAIEDFPEVAVETIHGESRVLVGPLQDGRSSRRHGFEGNQTVQQGFVGFTDEFRWRIGPRDKDAEDHGVTRTLHPCLAQVQLNEIRMQGCAVEGAVSDDQCTVGHLEHPVEVRPHVSVGHVEFVLCDQPSQKRDRRSRVRRYCNGLHGFQTK